VNIVWAVPVTLETIFVIPTPILTSSIIFSTVSLVILFCGSSMITWPIGSGSAYEKVAEGSEFKLSLLSCGNRFVTGWSKCSPVKGDTVGEFDELTNVRW